MGETGEGEDDFEAGLLRELGGMGLWSGLAEDDGGDVPSLNTVGKFGGEAGVVFILEWDVEAAEAGGMKPTLLGGEAEEVTAADAVPGLCSLVGDFVGEAAGAGGAACPAEPICGPRRVVSWRVSLSRAVLCQSERETPIRSFREQ